MSHTSVRNEGVPRGKIASTKSEVRCAWKSLNPVSWAISLAMVNLPTAGGQYSRISLMMHCPTNCRCSRDIMTSHGGRLTPEVTRVSLPKPGPLDVATSTENSRRSTIAQSSTLFIGMDVHKATLAVASIAQDYGAEVAS